MAALGRRRALGIMTDRTTIVGLDIGGSKTAIVEGTNEGEILQRAELHTESATAFAERLPVIAAAIDTAIEGAARAGRTVRALSISVGGPLRIEAGELLDPPHLPGWHGAPLKHALSTRFPAIPVYVEHGGNAGALAEWRFGAGRTRPDTRHLVFLTCGTGLGGGIIANGTLIRGASDTAGEMGFWRLAAREHGQWVEGTWDGLASGSALLRHACAIVPDRWNTGMAVADVVTAALAGEMSALAAVECVGRWLGRGLALLVDTLNPELIVVGTLGVLLGERLLAPARTVLRAEELPAAVAACTIIPAALGPRIGDVASLMAAIEATAPPTEPPRRWSARRPRRSL